MRADADATCLRELDRLAHDIGVAGVETAGDIHRRRQLDHRSVVAHFPRAKTFAEIAVQIDCLHGACSLSVQAYGCQVPASTALTACPATLAPARASMLNSALSPRSRSGRVRTSSANFFASVCASAMLTALKRKLQPSEICA